MLHVTGHTCVWLVVCGCVVCVCDVIIFCVLLGHLGVLSLKRMVDALAC